MAIPIKLSPTLEIDGIEPITLIGANGAGKTRLGAYLVSAFGYDRVSAQRALNISHMGVQPVEQAKQHSEEQISQFRKDTSSPAQDLIAILSELKAYDVQSASEFRDRAYENDGTIHIPEVTKLQTLKRLWEMMFPGRELNFSGFSPMARWNDPRRLSGFYSAHAMSDGERSAVYHIARLLRANPGPVVIDEPETHFHPMLARRFWDVIEANRPDCRFIYITHDLSFGLSRRGKIGIVRGPQEVEIIEEKSDLPPELFESILGAASLSVVAERIVFCEGKTDRSIDAPVYGAWFRAPKTAVVSVGSCETVRRAFQTFKDTAIIKNAHPIAMVERDYWPNSYLQSLKQEGIHILPAHEMEGLIAFREIAEIVADHLAINNFDYRYGQFIAKIRNKYVGILLNKVALERAKRDVDVRLLGLANAAHPNPSRDITRSNFIAAANIASAIPDAGALYDEHEGIVDAALGSEDYKEILKILPGKENLGILVQELGVTKERYIEIILEALTQPDIGGLATLEPLRARLIPALAPHLPPRECPVSD
ncbi:ABC-type lipoprotein export system ATPase subunit [Sphingobium sp. JAI105]|uniref:AAA family ATPase n=1 Tax=Sphingobium sp. JAI105 TaxID=2787715 RepID=UPI0018CB4D36|nr:AAA family ATPase [Sphingobium sp. JAI105]MBG6118774.1 ABC-type lipoprotein export system ATPase subunit [Sphingobium sp. JAI105]